VNGALARFSMVEHCLAIAWATYVCFNWLILIEVMPRTQTASTKAECKNNQASSPRYKDEEICQLDDRSRKSIWLSGVFWSAQRAFVLAALESAISLILEVESHWRTTTIGMGIGCAVLATFPVTCVVWAMQGQYDISQINLMRICAICVVAASVIFFPQVSDGGQVATPYMMLVGMGVISGAGYMATSIVYSLAMRCALPGTCYTVENLLILDSVVEDSMARLMAPPFVRYLLGEHGRPYGRTLYASSQMLMCILGFVSLWSAAQRYPIDAKLPKASTGASCQD